VSRLKIAYHRSDANARPRSAIGEDHRQAFPLIASGIRKIPPRVTLGRHLSVTVQQSGSPMLRASQKQRVAVPDAAESGEAGAVDGDHAVDDVVDDEAHDDDAGAQSPKQHVQRDQFAASEEAALPPGKGAKGQHDSRHHHGRVRQLLAAVFRAGTGQAVPQRSGHHPGLSVRPVPLARLLQQPAESDHLRDPKQGLPQAVPRDTLLPLRQSQPHDARGVLSEPIRRSGQ